jgi:hypothetical protein
MSERLFGKITDEVQRLGLRDLLDIELLEAKTEKEFSHTEIFEFLPGATNEFSTLEFDNNAGFLEEAKKAVKKDRLQKLYIDLAAVA